MADGPKPARPADFLELLATLIWQPSMHRDARTRAVLGELADAAGTVFSLLVEAGRAGEGSIQWVLDSAPPAGREPFLLTEATFEAARAGAALAMDWDGQRALATAV